MQPTSTPLLSNFFVAGINYRKSDALLRGQFAINTEQYLQLFATAPEFQVTEFFVLSTCNRTEIIGFAYDARQLCKLLCTQTSGSEADFLKHAYIKSGEQAIAHLFQVAAGLDSQLLGDYEIVGQLKQSVNLSRKQGFNGFFTDRLFSVVLQASKKIKNNTVLSGGTVSVSFSAVQYIRQQIPHYHSKRILLLGIGKIGRNTGRNLSDYLNNPNITLINRSSDKAARLADELGFRSTSIENLPRELAAADIVLVATNASQPVITVEQLKNSGPKWLIDLSIPYNIAPEAAALEGIQLVQVDQLSQLKDETLQKRRAEIPKALRIIDEHIAEFNNWYAMRRHVPVLKAVKTKLRQIHSDPLFLPLYPLAYRDEKIQRIINGMAFKMKGGSQPGCHYIEAINEFIATGTNQPV